MIEVGILVPIERVTHSEHFALCEAVVDSSVEIIARRLRPARIEEHSPRTVHTRTIWHRIERQDFLDGRIQGQAEEVVLRGWHADIEMDIVERENATLEGTRWNDAGVCEGCGKAFSIVVGEPEGLVAPQRSASRDTECVARIGIFADQTAAASVSWLK